MDTAAPTATGKPPEQSLSRFSRRAALPGTDPVGVTARPEWLMPMIGEFLDAPEE